MFADPQSVTYATVAKSLPAIGRGDSQSDYKLNDSGVVYSFTVAHQYGKRNRFVMRLKRDSFVADVLVPSQNIAASMTATFTIDHPTVGLTAADAQSLAKALRDWATDANLLKVLNGET